jgi:hypothetical protein
MVDSVMQDTMGSAVSSMMPQSEVDSLLEEVGTEFEIDVSSALSNAVAPVSRPHRAPSPSPLTLVRFPTRLCLSRSSPHRM